MAISASDVKTLREKTGAGMMNCKKALTECDGDLEKATDFLRTKGLAAAQKKQSRIASEGSVGSYIHGGRIGVMCEVNCETDFVSRNEDFKELVKDICMHIAAADPKFVREDEMDQDFRNKEAEIYAAQLKEQGKPDNMIEKIVAGKMAKLAKEVCLYNQAFVKNTDVTIADIINEATLKLGEKITVRRFTKYNLGEGIEKKEDNLADEVAKLAGK
jgi:elongation factor Ts